MNSSSMSNKNLAFGLKTVMWTTGSACVGYAGALIAGADPWSTAKRFAVMVLIDAIFSEMIERKYNDENSAALKNMIFIVWKSLGGAVAIAAFRNIGIISEIGVKVLTGLLVVLNLVVLLRHGLQGKYEYVNHSPKKYYSDLR